MSIVFGRQRMSMSRIKEAPGNGDPSFEAVNRFSLKTQAYQQIRKALMVGEFKPGEKLSGREIAMRLGSSLTPVREALLHLVAEGALETRVGQAITVPIPRRSVFAELSDMRAQLEGLGAERAAARIGPSRIEGLEAIHVSLGEAKQRRDYEAALRCNEAFHLVLCGEAKMPRLLKLVESLWVQNGPFLNFLYSGPDDIPVGGTPHWHVLILDALHKRDGAAARDAMRGDILEGGADLMRRLPE